MSNKRVLLIQPSHGVWDGVFIRFPESVLTIAALPHQNGYDVTIFDIRVISNWKKQLREYLKEKPICVGISSLTGPSLQYVIDAIKIIREIDNTIPIVFGGVHATLLPEQSLLTGDVDIVVKGDADFVFYELLKVIEESDNLDSAKLNGALKNVKGLYYKDINFHENNEVVFTGEADWIDDFGSLPESPYELLDIPKYNAANLGRGVSASFQTSRGCPFACKFCGNDVLQKRDMRYLPVPKVVEKIKFLQSKYGFNSFVFVDDLTIAGRKHFIEFTTALAKIRPRIAWTSVGIRANLISKLNEDDLQLLWDSGCRSLDIGIESGSNRILKDILKADTKENMRYANRLLSKFKFVIKYTFIVGYPTETEEERNETLDFLAELKKDNPNMYPMVFVFLPIVGTALYDQVVANGFKEPKAMKDWVGMDSAEWFYKNNSWIPVSKMRELDTIMISSLFCSKNAKVKFTTAMGKIAFQLYHPIAKLRYKYKFFRFPVESYILHTNKG